MTTRAYAAASPTSDLGPFNIDRREPLPQDVEIDILYCGVCHSDLHFVRNEWGMSEYPVVPGHEILGRVTRVGNDVTRFTPGDLAAVGCDSAQPGPGDVERELAARMGPEHCLLSEWKPQKEHGI